MSLLAHHNLVLSFSSILSAEVLLWSRRLCMICLLSIPLISFLITFPYFKHTGLLAISNMRTFPFMASVLAVSSFFLLQMSFFQVSACFTHSFHSVLSSNVTSARPFQTLPTISPIHPVSLHLLILVLPHILCPPTLPECRLRDGGLCVLPTPILQHLE